MMLFGVYSREWQIVELIEPIINLLDASKEVESIDKQNLSKQELKILIKERYWKQEGFSNSFNQCKWKIIQILSTVIDF